MKERKMQWLIACMLITTSVCQSQNTQTEEAEIRKTAEAYTEAFNKHNAEALAKLWAEDAAYVNPMTGTTVQGRDAIQQEFEDEFKNMQDTKLSLKIDKITFPKPDEAVEQGVATVSIPGKENSESAYRVNYVKKNGQWLIARTSEEDIIAPPTHYEQLKDLEWLIGTWEDKDPDTLVKSVYRWEKNKNFIVQRFSVNVLDRPELKGQQLIGWDPAKKQIRSWIFDSHGGFGEGTWRHENGTWIIESAYTTASGARGSATNIFKPKSDNSFTWESINREMNGEFLPNIQPVKLVRKEEQKRGKQ